MKRNEKRKDIDRDRFSTFSTFVTSLSGSSFYILREARIYYSVLFGIWVIFLSQFVRSLENSSEVITIPRQSRSLEGVNFHHRILIVSLEIKIRERVTWGSIQGMMMLSDFTSFLSPCVCGTKLSFYQRVTLKKSIQKNYQLSNECINLVAEQDIDVPTRYWTLKASFYLV